MDGELLRHLYHELFHRGNSVLPPRCQFSDAVIVFIYFLAVVSDRSLRWAHDKRNGPLWARHLRWPSYSQLMRRLRSDSVGHCIDRLNATFRRDLPRTADKVIDGKPLVVSPYSKDPDARYGRVSQGHWARGYKVHALVDSAGAVETFTVTPLNAGEATVARSLIESTDLKGAIVRGDANYDSNPLYGAMAIRGGRLIAPRRKPGRGLGNHPQHPDRLRTIKELESGPDARAAHALHRIRVEQSFAHLTNLPFGLSPLPNWVRRLDRVTRWVKAKITLYHLYRSLHFARTRAA